MLRNHQDFIVTPSTQHESMTGRALSVSGIQPMDGLPHFLTPTQRLSVHRNPLWRPCGLSQPLAPSQKSSQHLRLNPLQAPVERAMARDSRHTTHVSIDLLLVLIGNSVSLNIIAPKSITATAQKRIYANAYTVSAPHEAL